MESDDNQSQISRQSKQNSQASSRRYRDPVLPRNTSKHSFVIHQKESPHAFDMPLEDQIKAQQIRDQVIKKDKENIAQKHDQRLEREEQLKAKKETLMTQDEKQELEILKILNKEDHKEQEKKEHLKDVLKQAYN